MRARLSIVVGLVAILVLAGSHQIESVKADACSVALQGSSNTANGSCATVSGGNHNSADGAYGVVSGGNSNVASAIGATIGGGHSNSASGFYSTINGGYDSDASGNYATTSGGQYNRANADGATVSGGIGNYTNAANATLGGGFGNNVLGPGSTISGGQWNRVYGVYSIIAGGGPSDPTNSATANRVTDDYGTIGGGGYNQAGNGGGTVSDRPYATVGGGYYNRATGSYTTIAGGQSNSASGNFAAVSGGRSNSTTGSYSAVGGGYGNQVSGLYATIAGGYLNAALGNTAFAGGRQAKANYAGSFVWGDYQGADIASTANNQFIVRSSGGIWLGTTSTPSIPAGRFLNTSTGAYLSSGGTWTNSSDRSLKANIAGVNVQAILAKVAALPVATWNYKAEEANVKHIGPMAQDFAAAFGVGEDDKHIATVDADGVALAAIQGLKQEADAKDARIATLEASNAAQQRQIADLADRLSALEQGRTATTPSGSDWLPALLLAAFGLFLTLCAGVFFLRSSRVRRA